MRRPGAPEFSKVDPWPTPHLEFAARDRAVSSAGEHCFHTAGVSGSIPLPPTITPFQDVPQRPRGPRQAGFFVCWAFPGVPCRSGASAYSAGRGSTCRCPPQSVRRVPAQPAHADPDRPARWFTGTAVEVRARVDGTSDVSAASARAQRQRAVGPLQPHDQAGLAGSTPRHRAKPTGPRAIRSPNP